MRSQFKLLYTSMHHLSLTFKELLNPLFYITHGGLWLLLLIVFAETGLMIGFFLPGDSLLFVSGIYSKTLLKSISANGTGFDWLDILILVALIATSASLGNMLGYWLGKKSGPSLFHQKESFFFKKKYLQQAKEFYNEHGPITMITARFLPILRTFSPIVCGIVHMEKKKFVWYSIVGGIAWASLMLFAGHYLYLIFLNYFKFNIKTHLDYILIVIVLITTVPVFYKIFFRKER